MRKRERERGKEGEKVWNKEVGPKKKKKKEVGPRSWSLFVEEPLPLLLMYMLEHYSKKLHMSATGLLQPYDII